MFLSKMFLMRLRSSCQLLLVKGTPTAVCWFIPVVLVKLWGFVWHFCRSSIYIKFDANWVLSQPMHVVLKLVQRRVYIALEVPLDSNYPMRRQNWRQMMLNQGGIVTGQDQTVRCWLTYIFAIGTYRSAAGQINPSRIDSRQCSDNDGLQQSCCFVPPVCEWYGISVNCFVLRCVDSVAKNLLLKWFPLSFNTCVRTPCEMIKSLKTVYATLVDIISQVRSALVSLEYLSDNTTAYWYA